MLDVTRYTSGRIALANLCALIDSLERRRLDGGTFEDRAELSRLLFLRGDLSGSTVDHDRAESSAMEAIALSRDDATAFFIRATLWGRFHRFQEANAMLQGALAGGYSPQQVDSEKAALLQATGKYAEALFIRQRLAKTDRGIDTLGALASVLAEKGSWSAAEACYTDALDVDRGVSPLACAQLLYEWGVHAMRRGELDYAESRFATLARVLPAHVPGRGRRAEVALERGQLDRALALIAPLIDAEDPQYRATYAQILEARGEHRAAEREAATAAAAYERLLARRPEAYAEQAAAFFMSIGNQPHRAVDLAAANWKLRDTPRARTLLARAQRNARALISTRRIA